MARHIIRTVVIITCNIMVLVVLRISCNGLASVEVLARMRMRGGHQRVENMWRGWLVHVIWCRLEGRVLCLRDSIGEDW